MADTKTRIVTLTDAAQAEVARLLGQEELEGMGLRLAVRGGGCSGLSYEVEFTREEPGDTIVEYSGFRVLVDPKSLLYIKGVELDHQSGLSGRGFVFKNPNAENTCGCGESFSV